ncbi:MAG: type I 3-dehydroquinate dehydratase [Bacteroidota bacterium]
MIIVSITGPRMSDALSQVAASNKYADALEFRLDLIRSPELAVLLLSTRKPVIATCRPVGQGGGFSGAERDRMELLSAASLLGAEYVDLEFGVSRAFITQFLKRRRETQVILSHHLRPGDPIAPERTYRRMRRAGADIVKFAFPATDAWQNRFAFDFLASAKRDNARAVAIAMGEAGEPSRILYRVAGGWATYAGTEDGKTAAPGQIPARLLKELYRSDRLNSGTKVFGVIGNPVGHSKGVYIYNRMFAVAGSNAVYCRFNVTDLSRFMKLIAPMARGFSVTLPHKQGVMKFASSLDPVARAIGAANTLCRRGRTWWGTNTDAPAALDAIEHTIRVEGKRVLILGAGGAARAIAYEAKRRGASVTIANRKPARARALAREFELTTAPWHRLHSLPWDVLVNATPVGMTPGAGRLPIARRSMQGKVVFDAVYTPPVTTLLRDAARGGAKVVSGTEMYINQGSRQFRLFTGQDPDVRLMRRILADHQ